MCGLGCALAFAFPARATDAVGNIVVTATKSPEPALTYPAVTTLINGADLHARGAYDLRGALAEAAGGRWCQAATLARRAASSGSRA